jgi:hypothetical protein
MSEQQQLLHLIQRHMAQLSEHFDTVQIFCTTKNEEGTLSVFDGSGNWYARYGQVTAWMKAEEQEFGKNRTRLGDQDE